MTDSPKEAGTFENACTLVFLALALPLTAVLMAVL